jgi:hypothetical protein
MDLRMADIRGVEQCNNDAPWDIFDPLAYVDHNYRPLRSDDAEIVRLVSDHFHSCLRQECEIPLSGIDVGAGANLYPSLIMLPWCDEITLYERSPANVEWLELQMRGYDSNWDEFWDVLCRAEPYRRIEEPRSRLREAAMVKQANLFDLPQARWGMGTMFFVAESMSTLFSEFEDAVRRFAESLLPGAPYAATFMEGSRGYHVGDEFFPACSVYEQDVRRALEPYTEGEVRIHHIGMPDGALRPGYEGMMVACGRRRIACEWL